MTVLFAGPTEEPVNDHSRGLRAAGGALAIALLGWPAVGCSSSHPERLPPADDPVAWAGRVCSSLEPLSALRNQRPSFNPNNPAASRESLSRYFENISQRIDETLQRHDQLRPSPIPDGDNLTATLRGGLERMRTAFADAGVKVNAVDPSDPVALGSKLPGILIDLAKTSGEGDPRNLDSNPAFNDAVRQSPSCALIAGAAGARSGR